MMKTLPNIDERFLQNYFTVGHIRFPIPVYLCPDDLSRLVNLVASSDFSAFQWYDTNPFKIFFWTSPGVWGCQIHVCDVASVFTTFPVESHHQNLQFGPSALSANARLFCSRENGHSRSRGGGERNFRLKKYLPNTCTAVVKLLSPINFFEISPNWQASSR